LTYSFPCQDLSKAGLRKGMSDKTTRSGLLWEVERILSECKELPQVLLMENVPDVIGNRFISDFQRWEERLRELGYSNHTEILNSKDFGIPQNRERAFMVSILGSSLYRFPQKQPLKLRLKDMLEKEVDEKYYLTTEKIHAISQWKAQQDPLENMENIDKTGISPTLTARGAGEEHSGMVLIKEDLFKSKDKRLPEMLEKIDFNSTEPQSLDLYNRTISDISQTLTMPNHNAQAIVVPETKEYANYITWEDDKGRLNTQDHRAYFEDRLSGTIPAMERGVPNVITKNIVQKVWVRKHEVDIQGLKELLRSNKNKSNQELSNTLNLPLTQVEHWFRQDASFSIPPKEIWFKLKELLNITETKFDSQVVEFVEKDGEYDMSNRVYDDLGISPTLTTSDEKKVINNLRIRKLTPRECYRLMGFGDQAFELAQPNQSNSSLYHQAGDSIVVNVLMELFRSLL
jgi:DNA-cytosine methyltransferase